MLEINQMKARKLGAYKLNLMALKGGRWLFVRKYKLLL